METCEVQISQGCVPYSLTDLYNIIQTHPSLEGPERDDLQHLFLIGQSHTRGGAPQVRL